MIELGVDEAGRGALIGNVVASAVILPKDYDKHKISDSKKLSENKREEYAKYIKAIALDYAIAVATATEIDEINIHNATLLAMQRAINKISNNYQQILIDGKFTPSCSMPAKAIIKGDQLHDCISAASILAKTYRDAEMRVLNEKFPNYQLDKNKGYPTKSHKEAIIKFGILDQHRHSYKPIKDILNSN